MQHFLDRWCVPVGVDRTETRAGPYRPSVYKRRALEAFLEVLDSPKKEPAMTHHQAHTVLDDLTDLLIGHEPSAMGSGHEKAFEHVTYITG